VIVWFEMINVGNIYHKCLIIKCLNIEKLPQVLFNIVFMKKGADGSN
jgi:hypothetical protein